MELFKAAPSSYTALWQKAGDQPSYREPGPFGGCNFLSHKCFCIKETLEEHLASRISVDECFKNVCLPIADCRAPASMATPVGVTLEVRTAPCPPAAALAPGGRG